MKLFTVFLFFLLSAVLSSCGGHRWNRVEDKPCGLEKPTAEEFLTKLNGANNTLQTSKGLGRIALKNQEGKRFARIAWITAKPEKLFIQILNPLGQPVETIAYDGRYLSFLSGGNTAQPFHKLRTRHPSMEKLISIPIEAQDVVALLTGGVPVRKHHTIETEKNEEPNGYAITLKKRWWGSVVERIVAAPDFSKALLAEIYQSPGHLLYRVLFGEARIIEGYSVPTQLTLSSRDGSSLKLEIDKYWANVPVNESLFVVNDPNSGK